MFHEHFLQIQRAEHMLHYELYNHIFGKPDDFNYDKDKLNCIKCDLNNENATYESIKKHALQI